MGDSSIYSSLIAGGVGITMGFCVFSLLRKYYQRIFSFKSFLYESWSPPIYSGFFNWFLPTIQYDENFLIAAPGGVDFVIYLKFLKYSILLFGFLSLIGCPILIPINYSGQNRLINSTLVNGIATISLANIPQGSSLMWGHLVLMYVFTIATCYYLYKNYKSYIEISHIKKKIDSLQSRTVMVVELPKYIQSDEDLMNYFKKFYNNKVIHATLVPNIPKINDLVSEKEILLEKLRIAIDLREESDGKFLPKHWNLHEKLSFLNKIYCLNDFFEKYCCFPCCAKKVESIEHYKKEIEILNEKILKKQKKPMKYTQVGFVTFDSIATAMQCVQTLHQINPLKTVIKQAPDPNDINWGQLSAGSYERIFRRIITIIIVVGLFILWSIPVTFISALANIDNLSKISIFHFLINITQNHPVIGSLIDGFISSLALIIFMLLFPIILTIIEDWRGWRVQRERDCEILRIYWLFLIINVFLVTTIAGSIFTVLSEILKEPSKIPYLLAASLPQQSTVFINYIIVKGMVTNILVYMLRLPYFILCKLKQLFLCKTQREKMAAEYPDPFEYQIQYGQELLIFCISLTYSTMAPIISIFTTIYFILSYFWTKYNFIFVYLPNYEGIRMSHIVINRIFIGTLLFQITMLGVFSINYFPYGVGVIPLIIGTSLFWIYLEKRFWKPSKYLALEDCPPPDNQHIIQKARRTFFGRHVEITNVTIQNLYTHPALLSIQKDEFSTLSLIEKGTIENDKEIITLNNNNNNVEQI